MTAKLIGISIVTLLVLVAVGVVVFFFLMLGMNGVSERKAEPVFIGYFVLAFFTLAACAVTSGWGAGRVARAKAWPLWAVGPVAVLLFSVAGGAALFFGGILIMVVFIS